MAVLWLAACPCVVAVSRAIADLAWIGGKAAAAVNQVTTAACSLVASGVQLQLQLGHSLDCAWHGVCLWVSSAEAKTARVSRMRVDPQNNKIQVHNNTRHTVLLAAAAAWWRRLEASYMCFGEDGGLSPPSCPPSSVSKENLLYSPAERANTPWSRK